MGFAFDGAGKVYGKPVPTVNVPLTIACWWISDSAAGVDDDIVNLNDIDTGTGANSFRIRISSGNVRARVEDGAAGTAFAESTTTATDDIWQHACAVFTSATSRAAYLNGAGKGTNATSITSADTTDLSIGAIISAGGASVGGKLDGEIAEIGVWNAALTDAEVACLGKGYSPLVVRPDSLISYIPFVRVVMDLVSAGTFTLYSTGADPTVSAHPRVIMPRSTNNLRRITAQPAQVALIQLQTTLIQSQRMIAY